VFKTYLNASGGAGGSAGMQPLTAPSNSGGLNGAWNPSLLFMLGLVAAEIIAVGFISKHL
jgi:hypothetical protein